MIEINRADELTEAEKYAILIQFETHEEAIKTIKCGLDFITIQP